MGVLKTSCYQEEFSLLTAALATSTDRLGLTHRFPPSPGHWPIQNYLLSRTLPHCHSDE